MATRLLGADRDGHVEAHADTPHFTFAQPLFANAASPVMGHLMGLAAWETYLQPLVPLVPHRLAVVLSNTCDAKDVQSFWLEEGEVRCRAMWWSRLLVGSPSLSHVHVHFLSW
jgi:hypothetical protein